MSRCACCGKSSGTTSKNTDGIAYTVNDGQLSYNCFSAEERTLLKESSQLIFENLETKGVHFLIGFFKQFPQHQSSFKAFRNIPPDELRNLPKASNHGKKLMEQVAIAVTEVAEPTAMHNQLYALRARHHKRRVQVRQMRDMLNAFLEFFKQDLGKRYTPQMEMAWNKLISLIISILEESEEQQNAPEGEHEAGMDGVDHSEDDHDGADHSEDDHDAVDHSANTVDQAHEDDDETKADPSALPSEHSANPDDDSANLDDVTVKVTSNGTDKTAVTNGDASKNNGSVVPGVDQPMEMVRA